MLKAKIIKHKAIIFLMVVFIFVPLQLGRSVMASEAEEPVGEEYDYFDEDGYEYITGEVTWKGNHIIEKGLSIESGGTLILENTFWR